MAFDLRPVNESDARESLATIIAAVNDDRVDRRTACDSVEELGHFLDDWMIPETERRTWRRLCEAVYAMIETGG